MKGNNITTAVPADGYMDEDSAALQYEEAGLTKCIPYDSERYIFQLMAFLKDKKRQSIIAKNLHRNLTFMSKQNLNQILINEYKNNF